MRFMIVGHGAREHAIARRLIRDGHEVIAYISRRNAGLENDCHQFIHAQGYLGQAIVKSAISHAVDMLLPTDEAALFNGVADAAIACGMPCFGHTKRTAYLIEVMRNEVISALSPSRYVRRPEGILALTRQDLRSLFAINNTIVIKPLKLGDTVSFLNDDDDVNRIDLPVWAEPYKPGVNFSIHYMVSGGHFHFIGLTFDYPFLNENSLVLTGGMGTMVAASNETSIVSSALLKDCQAVTEACLLRLKETHGCNINGFVSAQFRKIRQQAIFTELDCKPGNPEIVAILPTIKGDLGRILLHAASNQLPAIEFTGMASVAISMIPKEYPHTHETHHALSDSFLRQEAVVIGETEKTGSVIQNGRSRMLCVVCIGVNSRQAKSVAVSIAAHINELSGLIFRGDIGDNISGPVAAQRVRKSLDNLKKKGGKRLMLRLSPESNAALKNLMATDRFQNETEAINAAIIIASTKPEQQ